MNTKVFFADFMTFASFVDEFGCGYAALCLLVANDCADFRNDFLRDLAQVMLGFRVLSRLPQNLFFRFRADHAVAVKADIPASQDLILRLLEYRCSLWLTHSRYARWIGFSVLGIRVVA